MEKYDHKQIEQKWQKYWETNKIFKVVENPDKQKFYGLIEFPYASGEGLHTGHLRPNTAMDVICRKKRMQGFNVLYPIGFDNFGLPTENYAIKINENPQIVDKRNIKVFTKQLKESGFSFDWSRSFATTQEDYYKWTQWIFVQMFKNGLAYKAKETINWCTACKIGLANEEVVNGKCERCGGVVIKKEKEQWMLRITKYADRLIDDLKNVDYLERIKTQQINWIGKSSGALIKFPISNPECSGQFSNKSQNSNFNNQNYLEVFTTRPDTLFGATFMVIAPEHELINKFKNQIYNFSEVEEYIKKSKLKSDLERTDLNKNKTGVELKGVQAINPVNNKNIRIFVADYVLMNYGTGAIMAVPAHDERDWDFAKKYNLEIKQVISPKTNCTILHGSNPKDENRLDSQEYTPQNIKNWIPWVKEELERKGIKTNNPLMPNSWQPNYEEWKKEFEKIEINEDSILVGYSASTAFLLRYLGETKKKVKKLIFVASAFLVNEWSAFLKEFYNFSLDVSLKDRVDDIVVFISDNDFEQYSKAAKILEEKLGAEVVELKNKGHFTEKHMGTKEFPELLDEILKQDSVFTGIDSGEMVNSEFLNGLDPKTAIEKITKYLEEKNLGKKTVQYKLRDWIFSRQRYWGEPIPMVYCQKCAQKKPTVLLIHGLTGHSKENWFPWFRETLEKIGYNVLIPDMPNSNHPNLEEWLKELSKFKDLLDEKSVVVGHSLGAVTACHFIDRNNLKLNKLILVAPTGKSERDWKGVLDAGFTKEDVDILNKFDDAIVNLDKVASLVGEKIMYFSENDPYIPLTVKDDYNKLNATVNILKNKGHFNEGAGIIEFCEILEYFSGMDNCGWVPVPEDQLPITLPNIEDFMPTEDGDSPLAKVQDWVKTTCPVCGSEARRETDVMPNWAGSNWYFIRYCDPKNNKMMIDPEKAKYWLPVDWYNGGMEHTTLHLLYSRFVFKFLYDIKAIPQEIGDEPYKKRTAHGMILGAGGIKMSKSKGNVINPDEYINKYGADTVRLYEMFMGPFDQAIAWDDSSVVGVRRFLDRVWGLQNKVSECQSIQCHDSKDLEIILNQTIKKVTQDIEEMKFNTAVSQLMILLNEFEKQDALSTIHYSLFIKLLSPFAPHLCEELWEKLGNNKTLAFASWPEYDSDLIQADEIELVVQVNGKVRDKILVDANISEEGAKAKALESEKIKKWLENKELKKVIFIKNKLISVVV
ncbi:MAG: alpha/beta fold hydrolase [Patescibacteria group bacterium]